MKTLKYTLFCLLVVAISSAKASSISRIREGEDAEEGFAPYMIALENVTNRICGGVIISDRHILTAAHCVHDEKIRPGLFVITGTQETRFTGRKYYIDEIIIHSNYNAPRYNDDIAMIRLNSSIVWNNKTQPIKLATENLAPGSSVIFTGWGEIADDKYPRKLQKITMKLISNGDCFKRLEGPDGLEKQLHEGNICTLVRKGQGVCKGDSGGPLVTEDKQYLIGLASWVVHDDPLRCAIGDPDMYASTVYYNKWIADTMKGLSQG